MVYRKDQQSAIVLKLNAELKVSFPAYPNVFSRVTTQTSLKLLEAYPLTADMLAAPKDEIMETIRSTVRFGEKYALARYDAICAAAKDAAVFGRALQSNAIRIRLYIKIYREYQAHLDSMADLSQTMPLLFKAHCTAKSSGLFSGFFVASLARLL